MLVTVCDNRASKYVDSVVHEIEPMSEERKLYPEDQARVDSVLHSGYNDVERKPFRPLYMMIMLNVVIITLLVLSKWLVTRAGITW